MPIERTTTEDGNVVITFHGLSKGLDSLSGPTSLREDHVPCLQNVSMSGGYPTRMDGTTQYIAAAMPDGNDPLWHDLYVPVTGTAEILAGGQDGIVYRWDVATAAWVVLYRNLVTTQWSSVTQIGDYLIWTNQTDGHYKWDGTRVLPLGGKYIADMEAGEGVWAGGAANAVTVRQGLGSRRLNALAGGTVTATLTPAVAWDFNAALLEANDYEDTDYLEFWFYVDIPANMVAANSYIRFGDVADANYFQRTADNWGTLAAGWNHVRILRSDFVIGAGAPVWTNIAKMTLYVDADVGDDVDTYFDEVVMQYADTFPASKINANWKNMYFCANSAAAPSEIYFSNVSGPDEWDVDAVLAVDENDGTSIDGLFPYYDLFLVGKTNTLHTVSVRLADLVFPEYQFGLRRVTGEHGMSSHRAVVEAAGRIFIWWRDSIYEYAGIGSTKVSYRIDPTLADVEASQLENIVALPYRSGDVVYWFFPPIGGTENTSGVAFNFVEKAFVPIVGLEAATAKTVYVGGVEVPLITDYNGVYWRLGTGTQFQGVDIDSTFELPWVSIGPPHGCVQWSELMFSYAPQAAGNTMAVEYRVAEHPREFDTAVWQTIETINMAATDEYGRVFIGERSRWIQIRFHATSAPWTLYWPVALRGIPLGYL